MSLFLPQYGSSRPLRKWFLNWFFLGGRAFHSTLVDICPAATSLEEQFSQTQTAHKRVPFMTRLTIQASTVVCTIIFYCLLDFNQLHVCYLQLLNHRILKCFDF